MQTSTSSWLSLAVLLLGACSTDSDSATDTGPEPAPTGSTGEPYEFENPCGDTTFHDLDFEGIVLGVGGQPAGGVDVELRDFTFQPPTPMASGTSRADGTFEFSVTNLKGFTGDCWGNGRLDYRVVSTLGDATDTEPVNQPIFNAIFEEMDNVVELDTPPLRLQ